MLLMLVLLHLAIEISYFSLVYVVYLDHGLFPRQKALSLRLALVGNLNSWSVHARKAEREVRWWWRYNKNWANQVESSEIQMKHQRYPTLQYRSQAFIFLHLPVTECQLTQEGVWPRMKQPTLVEGWPWKTDGRKQSLRSWGRQNLPSWRGISAACYSIYYTPHSCYTCFIFSEFAWSSLYIDVRGCRSHLVSLFKFKILFLPSILLLAFRWFLKGTITRALWSWAMYFYQSGANVSDRWGRPEDLMKECSPTLSWKESTQKNFTQQSGRNWSVLSNIKTDSRLGVGIWEGKKLSSQKGSILMPEHGRRKSPVTLL